jgi:hypothetical protein
MPWRSVRGGVPEVEEAEALGGEHVVELGPAVAHALHHLCVCVCVCACVCVCVCVCV